MNDNKIEIKDLKTLFKLLHKSYIIEKSQSKFEISPQWGKGFLVREQKVYTTNIIIDDLDKYNANITI